MEAKERHVRMEQPAPRRVMIGTPSHDGRVEVLYTNALIETIRACAAANIIIEQFFIKDDALLVRMRNDIVKQALLREVDDLVFIDSDMDWTPGQFLKLLSHPVDLVSGTARKKTDTQEVYAVKCNRPIDKMEKDKNGLIEVDGVGCAFTRMTKKCMQKLWKKAKAYNDDNRGGKNKMIFGIEIINGELTGEDIMMSRLWKSCGGKVYLDPEITVGHIGSKCFVGNFSAWLNRAKINGG